MNILYKIMFFSIFINISTGLMMTAIPQFQDGINNPGGVNRGGLSYNQNEDMDFNDTFNENLNPGGTFNAIQGTLNSIWDVLNFGWFQKLKDFINQYMFGIITVFQALLGDKLGATGTILFSSLRFLLTILYTFTLITFVSNRKPLGGLD